ncbi:MAG: hypothetical protein ACTS7E_00480 [Arsenophonus sp. NC-CH8-MAG3]
MNKKNLNMLILAGVITAVTGCNESPKVEDAIQQTKDSAEQIKQSDAEKTKQVIDDVKESESDIKNKEVEETEETEESEESDKLSIKVDQLKETNKEKHQSCNKTF